MVDPEVFYTALGKRIKDERLRSGMTQKDLASKVALTRTSVTNIELGRQKLLTHTLVEIADALNVMPADLLPKQAAHDSNQSVEKDINQLIEQRPIEEQTWIKAALDVNDEE